MKASRPNDIMLKPTALLIALIAIVAIGCGGGGNGSDATPTQPGPTATATPTRAQAFCGATSQVAGSVASAELIEISGLAASRTHEGVLWVHNDSGDTARIFAIAADGAHLATITLAGVEAIDWEDMAIGPGPDPSIDYLYLADIGDNAAARPQVDIYRLPEPDPFAGVTTGTVEADRLTLLYPDRPHDAETLLVDPRTGDLLIVTKELQAPESFVFLSPGPFQAGTTATLELVTTIDFAALPSSVQPPADASPLVLGVPHLPTAGDVSAAGDLVVIRTYGTAWLWERAENTALGDAFAGIPCEAPSAIEEQGEAIAFTADADGYVTISEGTTPTINLFTAE
ncbi:MAG: hypothetical protein IIC90_11135 [Chloroflexi bacterium]|nr:hypothetical protein [Chloroflexota bacterium]